MAHCVGPQGHVLGLEVDPQLAEASRRNLTGMEWVDVRQGDGSTPLDESFDAILINAGVTHPQATWLDALTPGGRMILPLTASTPAMGNIGKGLLVHITRPAEGDTFPTRVVTFVAIFSAQGLRDETLNAAIGQALGTTAIPSAHDAAPGPTRTVGGLLAACTGLLPLDLSSRVSSALQGCVKRGMQFRRPVAQRVGAILPGWILPRRTTNR